MRHHNKIILAERRKQDEKGWKKNICNFSPPPPPSLSLSFFPSSLVSLFWGDPLGGGLKPPKPSPWVRRCVRYPKKGIERLNEPICQSSRGTLMALGKQLEIDARTAIHACPWQNSYPSIIHPLIQISLLMHYHQVRDPVRSGGYDLQRVLNLYPSEW